MGFVDPVAAIITALAFLVVLLYKRVNLGIILNATALLLALLAVDWARIPGIVYETSVDLLTISVVLATFGIMLLSQLYKETDMINRLSESLGRIINNPKIVLSLLPAVIGFLPVAGGALMSAPLVDTEAERLKLKPRRRAYINMWFRHTIFPVYPINQPMIAAAALTGVAVPLIILRQIPVVLVMAIVGYIIGFWKTPNIKKNDRSDTEKRTSSYRDFLITFFPILATIIVTITLDLAGSGLAQLGFDVLIATLVGIIVLTAISKMNLRTFVKPLKSPAIYGITLAAYGAFLLRETMVAAGISNIFSTLVTNGSIDIILLLAIAPAILGLLTGSPLGGVSISVSILSGVLTFTPKIVALIYISAYLGYTIAPTHLCFTFTADYFKCSLGQIYRYVIPSFLITAAAALLVFFLL